MCAGEREIWNLPYRLLRDYQLRTTAGLPSSSLYRFEFANKLTKEHKLILAFDAFLLSEAVGREVKLGKIVHGDKHAALKVNTLAFASEGAKTDQRHHRTPGPEFAAGPCAEPTLRPVRVPNSVPRAGQGKGRTQSPVRHIGERSQEAPHKGIFTVTQLSHTFRPRRRRRKSRGRQEKHHHSLRALAIRENKIHAVDIPAPKLEGTPVFLDVEGLPDRDFYYLIGIRVQAAEGSIQHSFWADNAKEEKLIWNDFLAVLSEIVESAPNPLRQL